MGIVIKQGSKNAIFTYLGFFIGAIYTAILVPRVFSDFPEYWGVARLLISYAVIFAPFAMLGTPMAIIRYFPKFTGEERSKFIFLTLFWAFIGTLLLSVLIYFMSNWWFVDEKNTLFNNNYYYIIPVLVGYVLLELGNSLAQSVYKSVLAVFVKELFYRIIILADILLFAFDIISFDSFLFVFSFAYLIAFIPLLIFLVKEKNINVKVDFKFLVSPKLKGLYIYALFTMTSASAFIILGQLDNIMISEYLTLKEVAIYGPSLFIATIILVPSRSIMAIVRPLVANAWVNNSLDKIKELYIKTSIVLSTYAVYLFILIWININLIMYFYGEEFGQGKYVVLFISLGNIINLLTSINGIIINTSKYYKADIFFQVLLIGLTIITNMILIPIYGITGAAMATAITIFSQNLIKLIYVYVVFKIHPFTLKTVYLLLFGLLLFLIVNSLPVFSNLFVSSIIYSIIFTILFWAVAYLLKLSEDINNLMVTILNRAVNLLK